MCNINTGVHAGARRVNVSHRNATIDRDGKRRLASVNDVTRGGFWEILKKSVSWDENCLGGKRLVFACSRRPLWRVPLFFWGGGDEKARIERLCLSLFLCWRAFKLKGNKKFRTWTKKSSSVFRVSRFLCSIFMDIRCTFHTSPYHGYGTDWLIKCGTREFLFLSPMITIWGHWSRIFIGCPNWNHVVSSLDPHKRPRKRKKPIEDCFR